MIEHQSWSENAECAKKENLDKIELFFSNKNNDKLQAKELCFKCPVRDACLNWALENKQIWGVWGGNDEKEIKRTLSVNWEGQEVRRNKAPRCPLCAASTLDLNTKTVDRPGGGRWATMRVVECSICSFSWQSRTSANAIDIYKTQWAEKVARNKKEIEALRKANRGNNIGYL